MMATMTATPRKQLQRVSSRTTNTSFGRLLARKALQQEATRPLSTTSLLLSPLTATATRFHHDGVAAALAANSSSSSSSAITGMPSSRNLLTCAGTTASPWMGRGACPPFAILPKRRFSSQRPPPPKSNNNQQQQLPPWMHPQSNQIGHYLEQYCTDLSQMAADNKLDPVVGRHEEIRRCLQILARRTKRNPVLIGAAGVGKTAIAEGLAQLIQSGQVPDSMKHKRVLSLDLAALQAGAGVKGANKQKQ
jgi:ATP-dependent Clp protease ATP-binding subunit ClpA